MTNEDLDSYIEQLNATPELETIFTRALSSKVDLAKVWENFPTVNDSSKPYLLSYEMFFIKNEEGNYIGVVLDMTNDLHWYIQKEHRKKGYLSRALRKTVLPFIFYEKRDLQKITISRDVIDYENSKSIALRLGFRATNNTETVFELSNEDFDWSDEEINWSKEGLSTERNLILQKRISYTANLLRMISDELELKIHDDHGLREAVKNVAKLKMRLEDIEWEKQESGDRR